MEFWLRFHCAKYRRRSNGFIVAVLLLSMMIHLISMALCDRIDTKRLPPFERNHSRHSFTVTPFNWRQWQPTVSPDAIATASIPVTRTKWIDSTIPNNSRANDDQSKNRIPIESPWNSSFKSNAQREVYYGMPESALHDSKTYLEQRWDNVTERWPTPINQHNQIPKNNSNNLLTKQLHTNNAINSVHSNTIRMYDGMVRRREMYEFKVKLAGQRNCDKCRILPGIPVRSKSYSSAVSVSGMCAFFWTTSIDYLNRLKDGKRP